MSTAIEKLAKVAEALAAEQCEAVTAGQEPCPIQHDRRDDWCLRCLAAEALAGYHQ